MSVNSCFSVCVRPVRNWCFTQGMPKLLHYVTWDRLQSPTTPERVRNYRQWNEMWNLPCWAASCCESLENLTLWRLPTGTETQQLSLIWPCSVKLFKNSILMMLGDDSSLSINMPFTHTDALSAFPQSHTQKTWLQLGCWLNLAPQYSSLHANIDIFTVIQCWQC